AAYRFLHNPDIGVQEILSGHTHATRQRIRGQEVVLLVQDTTFLNYGTTRPKVGMGTVKEGVAKVLMCYDRYPNEKNPNTRMMARRNDHPSPALPQLSRHGYCPPWEDPSRQATLLLPREALCGSYLPAGVFLCWSIARGEATNCRYGYERQWHSRYCTRLTYQSEHGHGGIKKRPLTLNK